MLELTVQKKRRKWPQEGEIFTVKLSRSEEELTFYGKVLAVNVDPWFMRLDRNPESDLLIVAVYQQGCTPEDGPNRQLFRPQIINRLGWTTGYFLTVDTKLVSAEEHESTRYWSDGLSPETFYKIDWTTHEVEKIQEPNSQWIGQLSLGNHLTLGQWIAESLGDELKLPGKAVDWS